MTLVQSAKGNQLDPYVYLADVIYTTRQPHRRPATASLDRALRTDEDLDLTFCWRELRKVTKALTLHYERKLYLLADTAANRRLIGKYIEVFQYPDGRIEIRVAGVSLPYSLYEKLGAVDQGAIVENKRLGHVLQIVQMVQSKRDSRAADAPSTAHRADGHIVPRNKLVGSKRQRGLVPEDLHEVISRQATSVDTISSARERAASAALRASDGAAVKRLRQTKIGNERRCRRTFLLSRSMDI